MRSDAVADLLVAPNQPINNKPPTTNNRTTTRSDAVADLLVAVLARRHARTRALARHAEVATLRRRRRHPQMQMARSVRASTRHTPSFRQTCGRRDHSQQARSNKHAAIIRNMQQRSNKHAVIIRNKQQTKKQQTRQQTTKHQTNQLTNKPPNQPINNKPPTIDNRKQCKAMSPTSSLRFSRVAMPGHVRSHATPR